MHQPIELKSYSKYPISETRKKYKNMQQCSKLEFVKDKSLGVIKPFLKKVHLPQPQVNLQFKHNNGFQAQIRNELVHPLISLRRILGSIKSSANATMHKSNAAEQHIAWNDCCQDINPLLSTKTAFQ